MTVATGRREELSVRLGEVRDRIASAAGEAGRGLEDISLIVVTKTYPASDVSILAELGVTDVGENRHPEAANKRDECGADLRWHFLGGVQTNKAGAVARYADMIHSVDRVKLARSLDRGAQAADRTLDYLIQVDFSGKPGRSGVAPDATLDLAEQLSDLTHIQLRGLMTVAPLGEDPRPSFEQLQQLSAQLSDRYPDATVISAGMSEDFEHALSFGATHLRLGRVILGERPSLQ